MKRFLLLLMISVIGVTAYSQSIQYFRTTSFAYRYVEYGTWTNWSNWQECNVNIKFDFNNDVIYIYSDKTQIYKVLYQEENPYDSSGQQVKFRVLDQDGDYGHIRLRIENNGNSQIYIDFSNVSWVYNVRRTR